MKRSDMLSILLTFIVGVVVGAYLYVTDFAGKASEKNVPDIEEVAEFTIVSDVYGGCSVYGVCPSFQVVSDWSYRYLYTPEAGADQVIRQGVLPRQLQNKLRSTLTDKALVKQSQPYKPGVCNSFTDGIDVKYNITIDGNEYSVDSCGTTVESDSELWTTLGSVWDYLEATGNK